MATISLRRASETPNFQVDPGYTLRQFFGWDPLRELNPAASPARGSFAPAFEVKETKDSFVIRADVPGVKDSDLDIKVVDDRLLVAGKREAEKAAESERFHTYERTFGAFSRSFVLPEGVNGDAVTADLKAGVLTLTLPKLPERQPRKIAVSSA